MMLTTLLGLVTARWIADPVLRFEQASRSIAGGELEARVDERTTELLEAKESADAANQAKSRFLANISHEIRTPLAAMLGYVDLLSDSRHEPQEISQFLDVIRHNGQHLNRLLSDLLDISRIEAGRLQLEVRRTELARLVAHLRSVFAPRAVEHGLKLAIDTGSWLPWSFAADSLRLRQVLSNLLYNAICYTEEGSVTLRLGGTTAANEKPATATLVFQVIDTGVGISPADQARLFQRFTQLEPSVAGARRGFGLGLSITQQLLELMDGSISVESHPGEGSRFEVRVPVVGCGDWGEREVSAELELSNTTLPTLPPLTGRVLIAEDSAPLAELCQRMLERWGLRC